MMFHLSSWELFSTSVGTILREQLTLILHMKLFVVYLFPTMAAGDWGVLAPVFNVFSEVASSDLVLASKGSIGTGN
jgi:hypothetical protein